MRRNVARRPMAMTILATSYWSPAARTTDPNVAWSVSCLLAVILGGHVLLRDGVAK
jgi:hypothetical protein